MTSKEALEILNAYRNYHYNSDIKEKWAVANALNVILPEYVNLEERDTPMKPKYIIKTYDIKEAHCSICNSTLELPQLIEINFCPKCGKRLDWSDKE